MVIHQNIISGFIGTYTDKDSKGIYRFNLNMDTGKIENIFLTYSIQNPTYLSFDSINHILYSSCKIDNYCGVASFKYYKEQDNLNLINYNTSEQKQPCHISLDIDKSILISSNYHENKMTVYETLSGIILNYPSINSDEGCSINKERQNEPHIHCSITSHNGRYILSADLGIDKIMIYEIQGKNIIKRKDLSVSLPGGSGPRHILYRTDKPFYYVISELTSEIFVYKYSEKDNSILNNIQVIKSMSPEHTGKKSGSAIKIHPTNKFLYTSERSNNTINLFYIDSMNGKLSYIQSFDCLGKCPRDFSISNNGKFLICANKDTNNLAVFLINQYDGKLTHTQTINVPSPSCVLFT